MAVLQDEIVSYLLGLIEHGQHDDMLPSQNQLRDRFQVSTVTVRGALDKLVQRGLVYRRQGKGCFIRKVGPEVSVARIFLILPAQADVHGEFVLGLFHAARARHYHMIFYHYDGREEALQYELRQVAPSAVIWLAPSLYRDAETVVRLASLNLHVLLFNRIYEHPAVSYVSGDFRSDGLLLAEALAARSVRRVLFLSYGMREMFSVLRHAGLAARLEALGGSVDLVEVGGGGPESDRAVVEAAVMKLRREQYDAVVCAQGALWPALSAAVRQAEVKPEVMWFGNFNALAVGDEFFPRVVCSVQPVAAMAIRAVELIDRLLAGGSPERLLVPAMLECPGHLQEKAVFF